MPLLFYASRYIAASVFTLTLVCQLPDMRARKPTNGKVKGVKFTINSDDKASDLKAAKAQALKQLEEQEKNSRDWYDKELDKNMGKN